ncbi:MAG: archaetidylserine decarboxylase [Rudaea sp.]
MRPSVFVQYLLPHRALSRLVYRATRWTWRPWKNFLIGRVVKAYRIDMTQAEQTDPLAFPSFNAFFTRALKPGARPLPDDARAIACPADGRISQFGPVRNGRILQAKGQDFSTVELLGDEAAAAPYQNGRFVTIYLSPCDYHRVHAPLSGDLRETAHIPGRLFSVAPFAVEAVPRLFARNERLACHFDGECGPFAVVLVGAMLVSGVETVWGGVQIPPYANAIVRKDWRGKNIRLERGAELGRFNMGSTVVVLLPSDKADIGPELSIQMSIKMGQSIGRIIT